MDKIQAIKIVRETFEHAFDRARFTTFIKNLLNEPDLTDGFGARSGNYIPDAFKGYVEKYERLGKFKDEDEKRIDILIVHLKRETSIERARSMQRNFVAGYLQGKFGSDAQKDAALVAFVSPNGEDWRFSLVRLEVRLEANEDGKLKVSDEFTPAKRWSFLVGSQEKSHTAQRQFVPIMRDTDENPTLAGLEEAFNIETVTKEFFIAYRALFIRTKEELDKLVRKDARVKADFESKGIDTVNLAKKLLGQIVFLYYLQKKGWFGVPRDAAWGEGSRAFMRELFEKKHVDYKNFFNDVLEPLFYEALRIDHSHDGHYSTLFKCKIPFLNGGLFDPMNNYDWVNTDILLPNSLFSNRTKDDPEGGGILDVFDLYNFTVKEDEPFEKEVAIDPELLGKAYEKFNAIRPDNFDEFQKALKSGKKGDESKFNKQYGVYYTPREIVHYMCQQSLINYLYTELNVIARSDSDEAISTQQEIASSLHGNDIISKEDIALLIQHGENWRENEERVNAAGKETETYSYKIPESIRKNASLIDEKLAAIKVCDPAVGSGAFPVGMMSEIVKARDVLTTFIAKLGGSSSSLQKGWNANGSSSPLQGGPRGVYRFKRECIENSLYGVDIDSGAVEIAKLRLWLSLVVDEDDPQNIKPLPNLDYKIVCGNSLVGLPDGILLDSKIKTKLEEQKKTYFYATNPFAKIKMREEINDLFSKLVESAKQFDPSLASINFDFHTNFSEVFDEKGGFDVLIGNPPYVSVKSQDNEIKEHIKKNYKYSKGADIYVAFIEKSLNLLARRRSLSFIVPNKFFGADYGKSIREYLRAGKVEISSIWDLKDEKIFEALISVIVISILNQRTGALPILKQGNDEFEFENLFDDDGKIQIESDEQDKALIQKLNNHKRLEELADIRTGIMGFEYWSMEPIIHDGNPKDGYVKLYTNGNFGRYSTTWGVESIDLYKSKYLKPIIKLDKNKLNQNTRELFQKKPKIIVRGVSRRLAAILDTEGAGILVAVHSIIPTKVSWQYTLSLLNSELLNWYHLNTQYSVRIPQGSLKYPISFYKRLPIPTPNAGNSKIISQIEKIADRILAAKGTYPQADTSKEESAIDEMVYQLYGLTEEEIRIVEGKDNN
jgi:hypothetical protein